MIDERKTLIETKVHDIESGEQESKALENIYKMSVPNPYVEQVSPGLLRVSSK